MHPSIKGIAIQSVIEDVRKRLDEGRLSRDAIEVRLEAEDLRALDEEVSMARWYPIETFRRLLDLLVSLEAPGRMREYLMERGHRAADRIAGTGVYRQLELSSETFGPRVGSMIVTVSGAIYNFTRWVYVPQDPGERLAFRIQVDDARDFPDAALFTSLGFVQQIASRVSGTPFEVCHQRPRPDRIVFEANALQGQKPAG